MNRRNFIHSIIGGIGAMLVAPFAIVRPAPRMNWHYCAGCRRPAVRCPKCENTSCNGGGCPECDELFRVAKEMIRDGTHPPIESLPVRGFDISELLGNLSQGKGA